MLRNWFLSPRRFFLSPRRFFRRDIQKRQILETFVKFGPPLVVFVAQTFFFVFFVSATFFFCRCDGFATDLAFHPASQRQPASWPASWLVCWRCGGLAGWPSGRLDNHLAARSLIRWRLAAPSAWPLGQPTSCFPPPHAQTQTAQVLVGLETLVSYVQ